MSPFDEFQTASVVSYPYLWARQAALGETAGRKDRPTAVALRLPASDGHDTLILLPITSQPPQADRTAFEIPDTEKRRAGLDPTMRLWIVIDEYNADIVGKSFHLEPNPPLGRFSRAFFLPVARAFIALRATARGVNRLR